MFSRDFKIRIIEGITNPDLIVHVGTSGWSYDHWEGVLYPHQLPSRQELDCYTQHYQTVEVNSTTTAGHQTLPSRSWRSRLPQGFLMTVKAPRGRSALARIFIRQKSGWNALVSDFNASAIHWLLYSCSFLPSYEFEDFVKSFAGKPYRELM